MRNINSYINSKFQFYLQKPINNNITKSPGYVLISDEMVTVFMLMVSMIKRAAIIDYHVRINKFMPDFFGTAMSGTNAAGWRI